MPNASEHEQSGDCLRPGLGVELFMTARNMSRFPVNSFILEQPIFSAKRMFCETSFFNIMKCVPAGALTLAQSLSYEASPQNARKPSAPRSSYRTSNQRELSRKSTHAQHMIRKTKKCMQIRIV